MNGKAKQSDQPATGSALALLDVENASSASIRAKLDELGSQQAETLEQLRLAEAFEAENLLNVDDATLEANDDKVIRLQRQINRLQKLQEAALEKLEEAKTREAEQVRAERYVEAARCNEEANAWITGPYAEAAGQIREGLRRLVEVEIIVRQANKDRPSCAPALNFESVRKDPKQPYTLPCLADSVRLPGPQLQPDFWSESSKFDKVYREKDPT